MNRRFDFFITGTDTGVGKTIVTAAILAALRGDGIDAVAMKPVQTGASRGRSPDLDVCAKAAKWRIPANEFEDLCPFRFSFPASPHLAARLARRTIAPKKIIAAFHRLRRRHTAIIVEGAGGLLVPYGDAFDQGDLIAALNLPVVLVARAGLGTLNHTLLTVEALRRRKIPIALIVLSHATGGTTEIERDNETFLCKKMKPVPVVALPFLRRNNFAKAGVEMIRLLEDGSRQ